MSECFIQNAVVLSPNQPQVDLTYFERGDLGHFYDSEKKNFEWTSGLTLPESEFLFKSSESENKRLCFFTFDGKNLILWQIDLEQFIKNSEPHNFLKQIINCRG